MGVAGAEGRSPGGRCGRAGLGWAGGEAAGGWVQGEAGPQGRPGRRPGRRGRPQAAPESRPEGGLPCGPGGRGMQGRDRKAYHAPDGRQPGLYKKLYTISLNCHLFLPKIKNCVKYCSQFADIMGASERDGVPKKGRSEP